MEKGYIRKWKNENGYGFIAGADGRDYFVHARDVNADGWIVLELGQQVEFDPAQGDRGPVAQNVTLIFGGE
ncbi:cold-shock protein [Paenibacillus antri]|uniref:Cold-shock protein n=1 Tax=Paenibacillus antri TaxID=2582848 RepID=A0A5R9GGT5_9BACL|nr:cold shock domain-containing protein [Paenibacillus antri]TLS53390.1 cold-shock protein [Paenibacillus antri]